MAEIKTGIFAKNVQKRLNRAQEKVRAVAAAADGGDDWWWGEDDGGGGQIEEEKIAYGCVAGWRLQACGALWSDIPPSFFFLIFQFLK